MSFAGNSATNPIDTNDPVAGLISGFDPRVAAIIASVLVFCIVAFCCICCRSRLRVRRMRDFLLNNPHTLTLLRELHEGPPPPKMKEVVLEMDLEIGESFVNWGDVMVSHNPPFRYVTDGVVVITSLCPLKRNSILAKSLNTNPIQRT